MRRRLNMEWLKGKKTYIVLIVAAAIWCAEATGLAPAGTLEFSAPMLAMTGGATVAAKINRLAQ